MKKKILLVIVLFILLTMCKKNKESELNDPEWRKESLEISYNICTKLASCVQDDFSKIKKGLRNYAESEIKPEKCSERNKKSRIYLLKGKDPSKIKQVARECYSHIQKFSCAEIRSGLIGATPACEEMRKIQLGIFL